MIEMAQRKKRKHTITEDMFDTPGIAKGLAKAAREGTVQQEALA